MNINYNASIRKLKLSFRGVINYFLFKLIHRKGFKVSDALIICGSTRSGSTWLAEIITSVPGYSQIFEPLNTRYVKDAVKYGVVTNTYYKSTEEWKQGLVFFERLLSGKIVNPWLASQIRTREVLSTKRLVVKMVRGNLLLGWMCRHLPVLPPVLVIRHPCGVINSLIKKGWVPSLKVLLSNRYFDEYPEIRDKCRHLKKPEELCTLYWCLHYHSPLSLPKPYPFILITYEKLVRNGANELKILFDKWSLELTDDIISQLKKPSDTVTHASQIVSRKDPLAGWKTILTEDQVTNVLAVLDIFSMDFYSDNLEPDYDKLYNFTVNGE